MKNLQTDTKTTFLEPEQQLGKRELGMRDRRDNPACERLVATLAERRGRTYLVILDDERVRVEARVLEWLPFVFIPTVGIHMGCHVAETGRNVSHSSRSVGKGVEG